VARRHGCLAMTRHVLIVAGSDSSGGAGLARDIETTATLGLRSCLAVTAVTVQTHTQVSQIEPVDPDLIAAQMRAALAANPVAAIKIGMLGTRAAIEAVASVLANHPVLPVVLDPVLASSSGRALLEPDAIATLIETLMPACTLVTPNLPELAMLVGQPVARDRDMAVAQGMLLLERIASSSTPVPPPLTPPHKGEEDPEAPPPSPPPPCGEGLGVGVPAQTIPIRRTPAILIKGGHSDGATATDLLLHPNAPLLAFEAPRLDVTLRGTGCMLSSATAAHLAQDASLPDAVARAKRMVFERLAADGKPSAPTG